VSDAAAEELLTAIGRNHVFVKGRDVESLEQLEDIRVLWN
jgi:hypothetical protein